MRRRATTPCGTSERIARVVCVSWRKVPQDRALNEMIRVYCFEYKRKRMNNEYGINSCMHSFHCTAIRHVVMDGSSGVTVPVRVYLWENTPQALRPIRYIYNTIPVLASSQAHCINLHRSISHTAADIIHTRMWPRNYESGSMSSKVGTGELPVPVASTDCVEPPYSSRY